MQQTGPARTVVLAKNLQMFHAWCRETGHSPRDPRVAYVSGPHKLRGLTNEEIVRYDRWWDRPDIRFLEEALEWLEARNLQEATSV
ncbi:hypothetical protein [Streptomyces scabiei]|uniref:hypothetical protein n=1 Tax=Streptomyces scabiei TaxID=1930 RepID=UPI0029A8FF83|nr:hypothetical protein [Streptomyces scabiei]MDX2800197.1 hypothetical protein [Streptomyces scabiei]MDX3124546.1 hypothetical protein [Streptomyces scabiei]